MKSTFKPALLSLTLLLTLTTMSLAGSRRIRIVLVPVGNPPLQAPRTLPPPQQVIPPPPPPPLPPRNVRPAPRPVPVRPVPVRPLTIFEFARVFKPVPGRHDVVLCHPYTGRAVRVCFTLPQGCPRVVVRKKLLKYEIDFDYGSCEVELGFGCRGRVHVDFND